MRPAEPATERHRITPIVVTGLLTLLSSSSSSSSSSSPPPSSSSAADSPSPAPPPRAPLARASRRETEEKEAGGEMVLAPGTRTMSLWRAAVYTRTATANASRWAYNVLLAPVAGTPRLEYKEVKLPLNTEKLIELLFRCGGAGAPGIGRPSLFGLELGLAGMVDVYVNIMSPSRLSHVVFRLFVVRRPGCTGIRFSLTAPSTGTHTRGTFC